ncbi:MAG: hypothetical protein N4A45_04870 [Flavobacteriales bacterium]|jgi:Ulp1 family protease|nr:hypothetical protein [Flavobacteriales bacterium]
MKAIVSIIFSLLLLFITPASLVLDNSLAQDFSQNSEMSCGTNCEMSCCKVNNTQEAGTPSCCTPTTCNQVVVNSSINFLPVDFFRLSPKHENQEKPLLSCYINLYSSIATTDVWNPPKSV